ncbi:MAG: hypothetical protein GWN58_08700, partial [Anaerolineae bacterium]|nr:hypothetical protein [Anaerolineae bacterium]
MKTRNHKVFSLILCLALLAGVSATVAQGAETGFEGVQTDDKLLADLQDAQNVTLVGQIGGA